MSNVPVQRPTDYANCVMCASEKGHHTHYPEPEETYAFLRNVDSESMLGYIMLVTLHGKPIETLEGEPLQTLIDETYPRTAPNEIRSTIENVINDKAINIRNYIMEELRQRLICLKIDFATHTERSFISIHAQFIKDGKLIVRTLLTEEVLINGAVTKYVCLKDKLKTVFITYRLEYKQIYCIIENGQNFMKLTRGEASSYILDASAETEEDVYEMVNFDALKYDMNLVAQGDFEPRTMPCAVHILQWSIRDMVQTNVNVQAVVDRVRKIITKPSIRDKMKDAPLPPVPNVPGDWKSTYRMLIDLKSMCDSKETTISFADLSFDTLIQDRLDKLIGVLHIVSRLTWKMEAAQMTLGDFYIEWLICKENVKRLKSEMSEYMLVIMETREALLRQNDIVLEALYLDVRLNALLSDLEALKARELLHETVHRIQITKGLGIGCDIEPGPLHHEPNLGTDDECFADIDYMIRKKKRRRDQVRECKNTFMLRNVRQIPRISLSDDVFNYWRMYRGPPELTDLANCVLATPATQATSMKLFQSMKYMLQNESVFRNQNTLSNILTIRNNETLLN